MLVPWRSLQLVVVVAAAVAATAGTTASAQAVDFDPVLSLTGNCSTSTLDPIEDPDCPDPPHPGAFAQPTKVATDSYGNMYVASHGAAEDGSEGRIDIFDSEGFFITQIADPAGPFSIAVDSDGVLYVYNGTQGERLLRYSPSVYEPDVGIMEYADPPVILVEEDFSPWVGLAVNVADNHLFANWGDEVREYGSASEGNQLIGPAGVVSSPAGQGLAVDAAHDRIYAGAGIVIKVFELADPQSLLLTIDGSNTPAGKFLGSLSVAVDEETGRVFVYDGDASKVYEFTQTGTYLSTLEHGFRSVIGSEVSVDNGAFSPNRHYLFVPSHPLGTGHSFAFEPEPINCTPNVSSVSVGAITESEARLRAAINPCNLPTTYTFEYTTEQRFQQEGFAGATVVGTGLLPAGSQDATASKAATGLLPGTAYRFRVVAANDNGSDEEEGSFRTYPAYQLSPCGNDLVRTGFSSLLPDCRAYELVTPADTNGRAPLGVGLLGNFCPTSEVSPAGDKVSFQIEGGSIPGNEATGSYAGDPYLATRGAAGWSSSYVGPTGAEAPAILPGSTSRDQAHSFWSTAGGEGSAAIEGARTNYVRYPDGHSALVGRGSLGTDPRAVGRLISPNGEHIIFTTISQGVVPQQLEPDAPPEGTVAIYDRTADEVTHVISLLPGDLPVSSGQNAVYLGASEDGRGVAFEIDSVLYLRYDNQETFEIGDNVTFAGIAEGGSRIFYVEGGKLMRFEAVSQQVKPFNAVGSVTPVTVSADGSAAYFVSLSVLTTKANPLGAKAKSGQQNLYLSEEGALSFVGTVTSVDVEGNTSGNIPVEGLGLWTEAMESRWFAIDPSRTNPDGSVLLFESRANLTGYDSKGQAQIYRYDSSANSLICLSCNPTGAAPNGRASLQSISQASGLPEPLGPFGLVDNLRSDGRRAFFQSDDALVAGDTDLLQDVYEWEDQGVGSCTTVGGCVYLISSGHSDRKDYLYAVSESGDDVFFRTSDLLLPSDNDETPSIYDARVGGGFPEPQSAECEGEGCHLELPAPPNLVNPQTAPGAGNGAAPRRCPKGKRKVRRHGKVRCVRKHRRHHKHRAGSEKKGAHK
jgi:hypothetical protein